MCVDDLFLKMQIWPRQWERRKSNIFRWLAKQQLCTYRTTGDVQLSNFTFIENLNKWRSTFFFSLNFDTFLRNLTPVEFELASPIACSSRVNYCYSPLWRACSQAKVSKNARTLESLSFGSGGSRPSDGGGGGGHPDPKLTGGARYQKKNFSASQASVWSKNKGGGDPGPLGPSPGSATVWVHFFPIHPQSDTF